MNPLIDIKGLRLSYGERPVLTGVDLHVEPGEVALLLGNSGSGKSALLKALLGLEETQGGSIRLFGQDLRDLEEEDLPALRRRVGMVFQYGALFSAMSAAENVALPLQMHTDLGENLIGELVHSLLDLVGMQEVAALYPNQLSGGMRKRVALARALALGPELLCCDEPGTGLDPMAAAALDQLLLQLNQHLGITLVIVTQELLSIERLAGRLIMLDQGRVVFSGNLDQARDSELRAISGFFGAGGRR